LIHHGDASLAERIKSLNICCNLFGHEHDAYGKTIIESVIYSNACVVDRNYNLVNKPISIQIK